MSINSQQEKDLLKESLKSSQNPHRALECLEHVLLYRTPFALYVATSDRSDCTWIFDPMQVYQMLGGEDKYNQIFSTLFTTEEERQTGVLLFIFKKVGPLYSIRMDLEAINEIIDDLYNEI